jgi:multiple antibiotic resistance protein
LKASVADCTIRLQVADSRASRGSGETPTIEAYLQALIALLAIANPVGAAPIFLGIVQGFSREQKHVAALRASLAVFAILAVAAIAGQAILSLFGISLPAFRAAGGLVIVLMGLEMLRGEPTRVQRDPEDPQTAEGEILVPFAMPLVAGPGAITTVITLAVAHRVGYFKLLPLVALVGSLGVAVVLWLILRVTIDNERLLGERGQRILTRFMGLILVAIGFQLGLDGVREFFTL